MFACHKINEILALLLLLLIYLQASIPIVDSKALPQNLGPGEATKSVAENEIPIGSSVSSSETPAPKKKPNRTRNKNLEDCFILSSINNDYDTFLDFVNQTSQKHLEIFDQTLTAVEKELRPGTPLMKVVDWVLSLFQRSRGSPKQNLPSTSSPTPSTSSPVENRSPSVDTSSSTTDATSSSVDTSSSTIDATSSSVDASSSSVDASSSSVEATSSNVDTTSASVDTTNAIEDTTIFNVESTSSSADNSSTTSPSL